MEKSPLLKKFKEHLDRMSDPQTEEDYLLILDFKIRVTMHMATSEYRSGWADIIEVGTEVDFEKVLRNLTPQLLAVVGQWVCAICIDFCVGFPNDDAALPEGMQTFKSWYETTSAKLHRPPDKYPYPAFILDLLQKV